MVYLAIGVQCLLGTVFVVSSWAKLVGRNSFREFVTSVDDLGLLPIRWVRPVACLVVGGELGVCGLLLVRAVDVAYLLAVFLLIAFATAIALTRRRGVSATCRCFGASTAPFGPRHIVRNGVLAAAALVAAFGPQTTARAGAGGTAVAMLAGLLVGVVVVTLDDILDVLRPSPVRPWPSTGTRSRAHG
ncbi:MauE/DoxX family redox-associated membrane protein [Micromonospora sp. WMMD964]|nr:MauE/DoxX family redox-associated membrane protein [Micromonospora sp. WMMD964]WFF00125.1 MauE/DoxX family redox-associated membrane protein [Micromonospora sp. WMMD964]